MNISELILEYGIDYLMKDTQREEGLNRQFQFALKKKKKLGEKQMNNAQKKTIQYNCFVDVELEGTPSSNTNEISIQAVNYSFSRSSTSSDSKDIDEFELLTDALLKLPQDLFTNSPVYEGNFQIVKNTPQSITLHLRPQNFIFKELYNVNKSEWPNVLIDLIAHLKKFHDAGFILSFFDLQKYVAQDLQTNKYVLIGFPYIILDNDVIFRGINCTPDLLYAVRSQLLFKGPSKPSDYLALIKNFLVNTQFEKFNTIQETYFKNQDLKLITRENLLLSSKDSEVSLSYTINDDCNCTKMNIFSDECKHQSIKIAQKLPEAVIQQLKTYCQSLIEFEYDMVDEQKLSLGQYERIFRESMDKLEDIHKELKEYSGDGEKLLEDKKKEIEEISQVFLQKHDDLILKKTLKNTETIATLSNKKEQIKSTVANLKEFIKGYLEILSLNMQRSKVK